MSRRTPIRCDGDAGKFAPLAARFGSATGGLTSGLRSASAQSAGRPAGARGGAQVRVDQGAGTAPAPGIRMRSRI